MTNHETFAQQPMDEQVASDIVFDAAYLGESQSRGHEWVDVESTELAKKCTVQGIRFGRQAERERIVDALGLDPQKLSSILGEEQVGEETHA